MLWGPLWMDVCVDGWMGGWVDVCYGTQHLFPFLPSCLPASLLPPYPPSHLLHRRLDVARVRRAHRLAGDGVLAPDGHFSRPHRAVCEGLGGWMGGWVGRWMDGWI